MRIITILLVCLAAFVQMQCGAKDASQSSNNGTGQKSETNKAVEMKQPKSGIDAPDQQAIMQRTHVHTDRISFVMSGL